MTAEAARRPALRTAARRRPTRRSAALALAVLGLLPAAAAGAAPARFTGQVTDALRNPTHRLAASAATGRAVADLLFVDAEQARTAVRTCVRRRDGSPRTRTCFTLTTGAAGVATITPLRFRPGRYVVRWSVGGDVVARWRFVVVAADD